MRGLLVLLLVALGAAFAQDYTGTYLIQSGGTGTTLILQQDGSGNLRGTLSGDGATFTLEGAVEEGQAYGLVSDPHGTIGFLAFQQGSTLDFYLVELDEAGRPIESEAVQLVFARQSGPGPGTPVATPSAPPAQPAPSAAGAGNPLVAAPGDPLLATFSDGRVTLTLQGGGGQYVGQLETNGQTFPVSAQGTASSLNGSFTAGGITYLFAAALQGDTLSLTSDGTVYQLRRQAGGVAEAGPPNNPLAAAPAAVTPLGAGAGQAEELRPNAQYQGGTRVRSTPLGISFVVPPEWFGGLAPDAPMDGMVMASNSRPGLLLAAAQYGAGAADMAWLLNDTFDVGDGVVLYPVAPPQQQASRITARHHGGEYLLLTVAVLGDLGNGVSFSYLGTLPNEEVGRGALEQLAASVRFERPQAAQAVEQVRSAFAGKRLYSFSFSGTTGTTAGGLSSTSESTWDLCSNGTFAYQGSSESSGSAYSIPGAGTNIADAAGMLQFGGQTSSGSAGQWRVMALGSELSLVLLEQDGGSRTHTVGTGGQYYTLDGREVTLNPSQACN